MHFETYKEKTRETAVYPENYERDYVIHGLVDELGELSLTVKNPPSENGIRSEHMSSRHVNKIEQEMGDVTWYLARTADHFGFDLTDFWQRSTSEGSVSPKRGEELVEEALFCATKINGHQKKSVRDDDDRSGQIKKQVSNIVVKLQRAAHHLGVRDLDVVTRRNLEKLFDRKARNVLHGDGDNR